MPSACVTAPAASGVSCLRGHQSLVASAAPHLREGALRVAALEHLLHNGLHAAVHLHGRIARRRRRLLHLVLVNALLHHALHIFRALVHIEAGAGSQRQAQRILVLLQVIEALRHRVVSHCRAPARRGALGAHLGGNKGSQLAVGELRVLRQLLDARHRVRNLRPVLVHCRDQLLQCVQLRHARHHQPAACAQHHDKHACVPSGWCPPPPAGTTRPSRWAFRRRSRAACGTPTRSTWCRTAVMQKRTAKASACGTRGWRAKSRDRRCSPARSRGTEMHEVALPARKVRCGPIANADPSRLDESAQLDAIPLRTPPAAPELVQDRAPNSGDLYRRSVIFGFPHLPPALLAMSSTGAGVRVLSRTRRCCPC